MSLFFSLKNNKPRQIHIQKMKNHIKSYFQLKTKAFSHTCCSQIARISNIKVVAMKIRINCNMNFDCIFFNNSGRVIFSTFSLFFIALDHFLIFDRKHRINIIINTSSINSFHIQNNVQNVPSRHNLNVTKVCRKNCNRSQITNILHSNDIRKLIGLEQILDHRDAIFFIIIEK